MFDHLQEGCTALIVASRYGQTAVAEILLLAGADYFVRNDVSLLWGINLLQLLI